jgi:hypothetical protein
MKITHLCVGLGLTIVGLSACGTDDEGQAASVAKEEYPTARADVICSAFARCGCPEMEEEGCRERVARLGTLQIADAEAEGLRFDAACATQRIEELKTDECRSRTSIRGSSRTCADYCSVFFGSVPSGGICTVYVIGDSSASASNCAQGLDCDAGLTGERRCVPYCELYGDRGAGAGETCSPSDVVACKAGLTCYEGTCSPLVEVGQPCSGAGMAVKSCVLDAECVNDACAPLPGRDEACSGRCRSGFSCDPATLRCAAEPPVICVPYGGP